MGNSKNQLKREIGLWGLSANLVNIMVGAGIFALPAIIAADLGFSSLYAYLLCGVLISLVMLCFAEIGSKITSSGGAYSYIQSSFGPYFGFLTAIFFVLASAGADAAVINAIADIIASKFPLFERIGVRIVFFLVTFTSLALLNVKGVRKGAGLVNVITLAKLIPLLLLAIFSWGGVSSENLVVGSIPSLGEIGPVVLVLFFAFQGAECGLSVSGEVKNPVQNIPKAIIVSILGVLLLYIIIQTVSLGVLGEDLGNFQKNTLGEVAGKVFGPIGFILMTVGAGISMFGLLTSSILSMPRVLFQASKDKVIPFEILSKVHPRYITPFVAIVVYASCGFIFASSGSFKQLAIVSSASMLLIYFGVCLSVIKSRISLKEIAGSEPHFKLPGGYLIPILAMLIIIWLLFNLTAKEAIGIALFLLILTLFYFIRARWLKRSGI